MDDNASALNYIEIVPLDNSAEQFEDVKPVKVKVCVVTNLIALNYRLRNIRLKHIFTCWDQMNLCFGLCSIVTT